MGYDRGTAKLHVRRQVPEILERHAVLAPFGRYLSAIGSDNRNAALLGALGGGAVGAGLGYMNGGNPLAYAAGGAAVGGLGSYLVGSAMSRHQRNKEQE